MRAAAVNLSDLAASGATPEALLVTLAVPRTTLADDVIALYEGIAEAGVPVVGGDTTVGRALVISASPRSAAAARVPGRAGARPGDLLVVTGPARRRRRGVPRAAATFAAAAARGRAARSRATAHALLDLSDGIAVDAGHIARRSGVRCVVELDAVPLADGATLDDLGFGEDYELLAAVAELGGLHGRRPGRGRRGRRAAPDGQPYELHGWEHFASG